MLVLVRKCDESIVIGDDVVVTVLAFEGDRVKLGIQAPREITILRQELCNEVVRQNRAAAGVSQGIGRILPKVKHTLIARWAPQGTRTGIASRRALHVSSGF